MPLSDEQIERLLGISEKPQLKLIRIQTQYPKCNPKYISHHPDETYFRCASRGCTVSTKTKVEGIPYCMIHAWIAMCHIFDRLEKKLEMYEGLATDS